MSPNSNEIMSAPSLYKGGADSFGPTYTQPFNETTLRKHRNHFSELTAETYNDRINRNIQRQN